jgi:hypothetical protein
MALGIVTAVRSSRATQILNAIDAGAGAGKIRIYDGSRPATGGTATNLLAELTCADPSGSVTNGVLTFNAITADSAADATGTATWFRIVDSTNAFVLDGSVTATGGGGDMTLNTTSIVANAQVQITSFTITEGNA